MRYILMTVYACMFLHSHAQLVEPPRTNLTREEYFVLLIDSLKMAESKHDSVAVMNYATILVTEFQTLRTPKRGADYLSLALQYSKGHTNSKLFADVCNRAGLLMVPLFRGPNSEETKEMHDSARYWYKQAIEIGTRTDYPSVVAWANQGLLNNAISEFIRTGNKNLQDSIEMYYNNATLINTQLGVINENIYSDLKFARYLIKTGNLKRAQILLQGQWNQNDKMDIKQKHDLYIGIHDMLAKQNNLDTLASLRFRIQQYQYKITAVDHTETLHEKDQQYEVSRTKGVLTETSARLNTTNKVLVISVILLFVFALLIFYLFFLFRKNKRLSQRNELLLREQNHRVKNNLQMISSLLSLQSQKLPSSNAREVLEDSQRRISSVALLHRMLYEGEQVGQIEVSAYLKSLTEEIKYAADRLIEITLHLPEKLELKVERVTSLGLIVNELFTNSIKHVDRNVSLHIRLKVEPSATKLILNYADNGTGVTREAWMSSTSFGNQLIQLQSRQLRGEFAVSNENGFVFSLRFHTK